MQHMFFTKNSYILFKMLKNLWFGFCFSFVCHAVSFASDAGSAAPFSTKAQLGMQIFFDVGLSSPPGQSCASCHALQQAFSAPDQSQPTAKGAVLGRFGSRNVPSIMYAAFVPQLHHDSKENVFVGGLFLDGREPTLESQSTKPLMSPLEMGNDSKSEVIEKLKASHYAALFKRVYDEHVFENVDKTFVYLAEAIAEFERSRVFSPFTSKYDFYLQGRVDLTASEKRGLAIFEQEDKGNCAACHPNQPDAEGNPPLFTDFTYDNLGLPKNPENPFYDIDLEFNPNGEGFIDKGLGSVIHDEKENGKFRVPTLRNIAMTAPYTHNGFFKTLKGVIEFYNERDKKSFCKNTQLIEKQVLHKNCWPLPEVAENINQDELGDLELTEQEIDDLINFLNTLTDGYVLK